MRTPQRPGIPRRALFGLRAAALLVLLLAFADPARADIFRWEDDSGTVYFSDDASNIPERYKGKSSIIIREAPPFPGQPAVETPSPPAAAPAPARGRRQRDVPPESSPQQEDQGAPDTSAERDELASQVEQLKAKISAKEKLIKQVDEKQSLAFNPLRNRIVDPADYDLYTKYKVELPQDRERLQEMETRLNALR